MTSGAKESWEGGVAVQCVALIRVMYLIMALKHCYYHLFIEGSQLALREQVW